MVSICACPTLLGVQKLKKQTKNVRVVKHNFEQSNNYQYVLHGCYDYFWLSKQSGYHTRLSVFVTMFNTSQEGEVCVCVCVLGGGGVCRQTEYLMFSKHEDNVKVW